MKSETLSNLQLALLTEEEPSTTRDEVEAEARREQLTRSPSREHKPHPGRKPLPEDLPRVTSVIACPKRTCASCGEETTVIGYDESEQLDVEPAPSASDWLPPIQRYPTMARKPACRFQTLAEDLLLLVVR